MTLGSSTVNDFFLGTNVVGLCTSYRTLHPRKKMGVHKNGLSANITQQGTHTAEAASPFLCTRSFFRGWRSVVGSTATGISCCHCSTCEGTRGYLHILIILHLPCTHLPYHISPPHNVHMIHSNAIDSTCGIPAVMVA